METSLTWLGRLTTTPSGRDWRRLDEVYGPLLRSWVLRSGVRPADCDDLVQEVLLVVVHRVAEFEHEHPGAFRAWLRGILRNVLKRYFRGQSFTCNLDLDLLIDDESAVSKQWDRDHDKHLAVRVMRIVMADFTPTVWEAFRRQVLEEEKPAAVAAALGITVNSTLLAKSRVLKRLRQELESLVD